MKWIYEFQINQREELHINKVFYNRNRNRKIVQLNQKIKKEILQLD